MGVNRASKTKRKRRSCPMCKPHKMGWGPNKKPKEKQEIEQAVKASAPDGGKE